MNPKLVERCMAEFQRMDDEVLVVLKGHLLIEERLNAILSKFVFHPSFLEKLGLRFQQKVQLARAMSLDEHENRVWELIIALNTLRNEMAHALVSEKRDAKTKTLHTIYSDLTRDEPDSQGEQLCEPHTRMMFAASYCIGFLAGFEDEVERYRRAVDALDRTANPHRHEEPA